MTNRNHKVNFTTPPPVEGSWRSSDTLGSKIETMFTRFVQRVISWGSKFIADLAVDIFDASMQIMRPGTKRATDSIINQLMRQKDIPDWFKTSLEAISKEEGESAFLVRLAVLWASMMSIITGGSAPFRRLAEYGQDSELRSFLPSVTEAAFFKQIGMMSDNGFNDTLNKLGVDDRLKPLYMEFARNLLSAPELFNALWRGVYSQDEFNKQLVRMGYNEKDRQVLNELTKNLPPLQDIIRMMVRDVFNEQAVSKYGYDEDYPSQANDYFTKQGYDAEWAKRYWRAHWNLPSVNMVYEMFHRQLIDKGTMEELLRIADYPKYWRDLLIQISYTPYTRVDIRRMFQTGILTRDQVKKAYQDIGYDTERAENLTKFTELGASSKEKDLTRADLQRLYEDNLISRDEAKTNLVKLGYDSDESEKYLQLSDLDIAQSELTANIAFVREKYIKGDYADTQAAGELAALDLNDKQVERYLIAWDRSKESQVKVPSKADASKFYLDGLIEADEYKSIMSRLGYEARYIELYLQQLDNSQAESEDLENA